MEDIKQKVLGLDWDSEKKAHAIVCLKDPKNVTLLSDCPPDIFERLLEEMLPSGELAAIAVLICCNGSDCAISGIESDGNINLRRHRV